jgi:Ca2+-transporting ATPase
MDADSDRKTPWHAKPLDAVAAELGTDPLRGIGRDEAARRLGRFGPNRIESAKTVSAWMIFLGQFASVVIWVLLGAAAVSAALGELGDAIAIFAIVVLNAIVGFIQEYRAEQAVAALARMASPRARVIRDGRGEVLAAAQVVPGDLLLLDEGDLVAADARLVECSSLRTIEAALTGESTPVEKRTAQLVPDTPLADRANMVFMGTSVVRGTGRALVVATARQTEFGRIAQLLETAESGTTPLQRQLDQAGKRLLWASLAIVVVVFALGVLRSVGVLEMFLGAVSLAVAAIPEGLPAVVTVALSLGVARMVRRNVLVRRLHSVETLGCATVICTDKTGTLTVGQMTARRLMTPAAVFTVTGEGYSREGAIFADGVERSAAEDPELYRLLRAAAGCNEARLAERNGEPYVVGDPTEGALLVAAAKGGFDSAGLEGAMPKVGALPFSSERKRMAVIRRRGERVLVFVKGAPEVVLARCTRIADRDGTREMSEADRAKVLEANAIMANEALRVIACAERVFERHQAVPESEDQLESDLVFLGLFGLQDPPRAEAREAVRKCKRAGIRVVMITGDHPDTARAIARELEILWHGDEVLTGADLSHMSDDEFARHVPITAAYARVTAEDKLRIIRGWKRRGAVVAMTGDGVNDAPALKEAAIGIAMGITGTEVTKEAADVVITDDNFASIVAAVEEGRGIYDNIWKCLSYLVAGNVAELLVMLAAGVVGWPLPLLPAQLLWINLVTDGFPALALATDPIEPDVLARPPRRPESQIMDRGFFRFVMFRGILAASVALAAFAYELQMRGDVDAARAFAFTVLVVEELLRSFSARSTTRTIWEVGLLTNIRLFFVVAVSFALQLVIVQTPLLEWVFDTRPLHVEQCLVAIGLGVIPLIVIQVVRAAARRRLAVAR